MIAEAAAAIKKWAVEHLFYLKKACLTANLGTASKGLCFIVDADFYIGGKNGKHIMLENKEVRTTYDPPTEGKRQINTYVVIGRYRSSAVPFTFDPFLEIIRYSYGNTAVLYICMT